MITDLTPHSEPRPALEGSAHVRGRVARVRWSNQGISGDAELAERMARVRQGPPRNAREFLAALRSVGGHAVPLRRQSIADHTDDPTAPSSPQPFRPLPDQPEPNDPPTKPPEPIDPPSPDVPPPAAT